MDAQTLGWGRVSDMSFSSNQLIGASYQATNISVWVASMNGLQVLRKYFPRDLYDEIHFHEIKKSHFVKSLAMRLVTACIGLQIYL